MEPDSALKIICQTLTTPSKLPSPKSNLSLKASNIAESIKSSTKKAGILKNNNDKTNDASEIVLNLQNLPPNTMKSMVIMIGGRPFQLATGLDKLFGARSVFNLPSPLCQSASWVSSEIL